MIEVKPYRYYPPRLPGNRATDRHLWLLWRAGLDSYDIALQMDVPEWEVVSRLWQYREARRA